MALYQVRWHKDNPNSSYWYTLNGTITYTSAGLIDWCGGEHVALLRYLHRRGYTVTQLNHRHCVPPTIKYHQQLLDTVTALLTLMEKKDG